MEFGTLEYAVVALHALIALVFLGNGVGIYTRTGDPVGLGINLVLAALIVGLGVTIARMVARRN